MSIEFKEFDKIARLRRNVMVTEKIDGTNAAVRWDALQPEDYDVNEGWMIGKRDPNILHIGDLIDQHGTNLGTHCLRAQSRSRFIVPGTDNYGFAKWVSENIDDLKTLGPGTHYGEWWGAGIQRRYDQQEKHFSLFNAHRWGADKQIPPTCCRVVPILSMKTIDIAVQESLAQLREQGSAAAPGFMKPEGVVVWHTQSKTYYKVTLEKDEMSKGEAAARA